MRKILFLTIVSILVISLITFNLKTFTIEEKIFAANNTANTGPIMESDVFYNFLSWRKSTSIKDFDPVYILIKSATNKSVSGTATTTNYPNIITDVNGDGLPDILITNYIGYVANYQGVNYYEYQYFYSLLINKGNLDYEVAYRCVAVNGQYSPTVNRAGYYGDCAK